MTEPPRSTMPGEGLPQALYEAVSCLERRIQIYFRGTRLHWGLRRILQQLWVQDGLSQAELAAAVRFSEASISNMLKHLVNGEWVERRPDRYDYRISRVYLAERGRALRADVERELALVEAELRTQIGSDDADELGKLLGRALEVLRIESGSSEPGGPTGIYDRPSPPSEL